MWNVLGSKLVYKVHEFKGITVDELKQIQDRQRHFYKMTLPKQKLDKFEPGYVIKDERDL